MDALNEQIDVEAARMLQMIRTKIIPGDKETAIYEDCVAHIRRRKLERESSAITARLDDPDLDEEEVRQLMTRQIEIQKSIKG